MILMIPGLGIGIFEIYFQFQCSVKVLQKYRFYVRVITGSPPILTIFLSTRIFLKMSKYLIYNCNIEINVDCRFVLYFN